MKTYKIDTAITAENVNKMKTAVNYRGQTVISDKVTWKIAYCQSLGAEDIAAAGSSGISRKDGILINRWSLFFSRRYRGKMLEIAGLSGFAGNNPLCIIRAMDPDSICSKCFSFIGSKRSNLAAWTKNDVILSTVTFEPGDVVLDPDLIPEMRFSTHGDLINAQHAYNLLTIAAGNPQVQFTLWTKNHKYYAAGLKMFIEKYGSKPENMRVLFSGSRLDYMYTEKQLFALKAHGYDGIFSVYATRASHAAAVAASAYSCVCGSGSCKHRCHFCYDYFRSWTGTGSDKAVWIAEILDGENHKE